MANEVPLSLLKSHLKITHDAEDALLEEYAEAARAEISQWTDTPDLWTTARTGGDLAALTRLQLVLVTDLYFRRSGSSGTQISYTPHVSALLARVASFRTIES